VCGCGRASVLLSHGVFSFAVATSHPRPSPVPSSRILHLTFPLCHCGARFPSRQVQLLREGHCRRRYGAFPTSCLPRSDALRCPSLFRLLSPASPRAGSTSLKCFGGISSAGFLTGSLDGLGRPYWLLSYGAAVLLFQTFQADSSPPLFAVLLVLRMSHIKNLFNQDSNERAVELKPNRSPLKLSASAFSYSPGLYLTPNCMRMASFLQNEKDPIPESGQTFR